MGALYGIVVFVVMNFVVVPLSRAPHRHGPPSAESIALNLAAMVLFGLIVALSAARALEGALRSAPR